MFIDAIDSISFLLCGTARQYFQKLHTGKSFRIVIKSTRNQIVFTIIRLIWNQTDVRLFQNQSENGKYNLISVWSNKIRKRSAINTITVQSNNWNKWFFWGENAQKISFYNSFRLLQILWSISKCTYILHIYTYIHAYMNNYMNIPLYPLFWVLPRIRGTIDYSRRRKANLSQF